MRREPAIESHHWLQQTFVVEPRMRSSVDPAPARRRQVGVPSDCRWALVTDEDAICRAQLSRSFCAVGVECYEAATPTQALEMANRRGPGFIATADVKVGSYSGVQLLRALSSEHRPAHTAIVSSYPSIADAVQMTRLGIDAYLTKPTTAVAILAAIAPGPDFLESSTTEKTPGGPRDEDWLTLDRAKWEYISLVLRSSRSLAQAARRLGLQPRSLRRMLHKYPPAR
jgi:ActR/RegA family two-component response regulator